MPLTPIEWIAGILAFEGLVKLVVIDINRKVWLSKVVKPVYSFPVITGFVSLFLSGIVLWFLLQELNIVQIFGAMAFMALLVTVGVSLNAKELMPVVEKIYKKKFTSWVWFYCVIWLVLSAWVLWKVFVGS